jgi:hypothetical protein
MTGRRNLKLNFPALERVVVEELQSIPDDVAAAPSEFTIPPQVQQITLHFGFADTLR